MGDNVLYEKVDMLSLMESIEDNSKDFILLFMPTGDGSIQGYFDDDGIYALETNISDYLVTFAGNSEKFIRYDYKEKISSFENSVFIDEDKYNKYMDLISRVVQNARRILNDDGTLCFGIPKELQLVHEGKGVTKPDIEALLLLLFSDVRILEVPNFDINNSKFKGIGTPYHLFLCGPKVRNWSKDSNSTINYIKRSDLPHTKELFEKYADILPQIAFRIPYKGTLSLDPITDDSLAVLNEVLIHELHNKVAEDILFEDNGICMRNDVYMPLSEEAKRFKDEFKRLVEEDASFAITRLSTCLIKTFCEEGDRALFPYDRRGQNAYFANVFGLSWISNIDNSCNIPLTKNSKPGRNITSTTYIKGIPCDDYVRRDKVANNFDIKHAPIAITQSNSWDKKTHNILYRNKDLLQVMESCESDSKDIIVLYMPCSHDAVPGYFIEADSKEDRNVLFRRKNDVYVVQDFGDYNIDYGNAVFVDEEKYKDYLALISKVIQNAKRILNDDGIFCFAVPKYLLCRTNSGTIVPEIELMIQQEFSSIRSIGEICYDTSQTAIGTYATGTEYDMFLCGKKIEKWSRDEAEALSRIQRRNSAILDKILIKYVDLVGSNEIQRNRLQRILNTLLVREFTLCNERYNLKENDYLKRYFSISEIPDEHSFSSAESFISDDEWNSINEQIEKKERRYANFQNDLLNYYDDHIGGGESLAECLMQTFCKEGTKALFPYDRNAEMTYSAYNLGMEWESACVESITRTEAAHNWDDRFVVSTNFGRGQLGYKDEMGNVIDYLSHKDNLLMIPSKSYTERESLREHNAVKYDSNFLFSTADANEMKGKVAKYSNLLNQVVQCAAENGDDSSPDMEQAVHALISLAVSGQNGRIQGDEAEKWFGEGWERLSEQCRNYLQTAAAYEKLSLQNGNADCAPIAIEYCRALELETNSVVMKPYIDYYYKEGFQNKTYEGDYQTIDKFKKAVRKQRKSPKEGMMLGQIGTCMRNAPDSVDDKNIFYSFKKYCEDKGKEQLLDVDAVGEFQLVGKIRNQSAHPSLLDKGCVSQAKQLVRMALKTQLALETKFARSTLLSCAVVCSPKGNKIDPKSDKLRKAVANQIEMMAQSGIKIFVLTGKFGFNQIVAEEIQKYIKANANKDWGKIMVNNMADRGEASKRQKDALTKAQFCMAYYADNTATQGSAPVASVSETKTMIDEAIEGHGLIVWNAYGIE